MAISEYNPDESRGIGEASTGNPLDLRIRRLAHDLNNQLTVIHGNTELAQMDTEADHPVLESVLEIKAACNRARELVRQILEECHRYAESESVPPPTMSATPKPKAAEAVKGSQGRSILLVDDEPSFLDLAKRFLERYGHRVTSFLQPEAALESFREKPKRFDLIISDVNMPGLSGFDLAKAIQTIRPDAPIILTSGVVRSDDLLRAQQSGIQRIVTKPDTIEAFVEMIQEMLKP